MTVEQAIKKYKLQPVSVSVAKVKAKELNVEEVLYMNVQKNKYAYIVKDGARESCFTPTKEVFIPNCIKDLR